MVILPAIGTGTITYLDNEEENKSPTQILHQQAFYLNQSPFTHDFEEGDLRGWLKENVIRDPVDMTYYPNPFDLQPVYGDNPIARGRGQPANHQGGWWIGTYENYQGKKKQILGGTQGDDPQGILTSQSFMIEPGTLSFLVGGGSDYRTRVELQTLDETEQKWITVYSASGENTETMRRVTWDLTLYNSSIGRIRIVDLSSDGWGHINTDDFVFVFVITNTTEGGGGWIPTTIPATIPATIPPGQPFHFNYVWSLLVKGVLIMVALVILMSCIGAHRRKSSSDTTPSSHAPETGPNTEPLERVPDTVPRGERSECPPPTTSTKEATDRVVSTGFTSRDIPDTPINPMTPLKQDAEYYFWLEIGKPVEGSIETKPSDIPDVAEGARLTVVLFGCGNGIEIREKENVGELDVLPGGKVKVVRQPIEGKDDLPDSRHLENRLFFPVRTPEKIGCYGLRCNIYYKQILLQSRLIQAEVGGQPTGIPALRSDLDYTLLHTFDADNLLQFKEHKLSIFLNQNTDTTHTFYFEGAEGGKVLNPFSVSVDAGDLKNLLEIARGSLRYASWKSEEKWKNEPYCHQNDYEAKDQDRKEKLENLKKDLRNMAYFGSVICNKIYREEIAALLSESPVLIQVVSQEDKAKMMFPASMLYDYPYDEACDDPSIKFCPEFEDAFLNNRPLESTACFKGHCPTLKKYRELEAKLRQELKEPECEDRKWICPSGFWGFRHYLGMPLSVGKEEGNRALPKIPIENEMHISVAFAQDLKEWEDHYKALWQLFLEKDPRSDWKNSSTREDLVRTLKEQHPHIVYFYCHGGEFRGRVAYLRIGTPNNPANFRPDDKDDKIVWDSPRPLVFLNGCHTAEVDPDTAFDLIDPFVKKSRSAGVIGTEITIFEPMASRFAKEFFELFVTKGEPVGVAVRNARLRILDYGDPMGLVYIPFVYAGLTLEKEKRSEPGG